MKIHPCVIKSGVFIWVVGEACSDLIVTADKCGCTHASDLFYYQFNAAVVCDCVNIVSFFFKNAAVFS